MQWRVRGRAGEHSAWLALGSLQAAGRRLSCYHRRDAAQSLVCGIVTLCLHFLASLRTRAWCQRGTVPRVAAHMLVAVCNDTSEWRSMTPDAYQLFINAEDILQMIILVDKPRRKAEMLLRYQRSFWRE